MKSSNLRLTKILLPTEHKEIQPSCQHWLIEWRRILNLFTIMQIWSYRTRIYLLIDVIDLLHLKTMSFIPKIKKLMKIDMKWHHCQKDSESLLDCTCNHWIMFKLLRGCANPQIRDERDRFGLRGEPSDLETLATTKKQKNASSSIRYWRYYQTNLAVAHNARGATRHTRRTARTCAHSIRKLPGILQLNSSLGPDCRQSPQPAVGNRRKRLRWDLVFKSLHTGIFFLVAIKTNLLYLPIWSFAT